MRQLRRAVVFGMLVSAIAVGGQQATSGTSSPVDALYAQPGQLVDVGGFRLNLYCRGSGSPTVVLNRRNGDLNAGYNGLGNLLERCSIAQSL